MCVIIVCPEKSRPALATLEACEKQNPHGAGVAWRENGKVHWRKNLSARQTKEMINGIEGEIVIHFRWASVGGVDPHLCHPFPCTPLSSTALNGTSESVLFHNGTWPAHRDELDFLPALKGPVSDSRVIAILVRREGQRVLGDIPGRLVVFTAYATHLHGDWSWHGKLRVSNVNFRRHLPGFRHAPIDSTSPDACAPTHTLSQELF